MLAAHQSATITYEFTYRATGNHVLDNTACVPAAEAQVPANACDTVSVPGSGLVHRKSVSPASGTAVEVGDVLTYTLTFDNTVGATAATVNTTDDLSAVLDDAPLSLARSPPARGLSANLAGTDLDVTGTVPAGATRTVTYQVTVRPYAAQGDHVITNALACEPGEPAPCAPETTSNPVRHMVLTKAKTAPAAPDTGDHVTYTLTVHNDGAGDWTAGDPASVVDDLSGVLDDATWDNTATATAGTVSYAGAARSPGPARSRTVTTVTITYTVTVTNLGDHVMSNTASVPGCPLARVHAAPGSDPAAARGAVQDVGACGGSAGAAGRRGHLHAVVDQRRAGARCGGQHRRPTGVLDDAVVVTEPTSSDPAVTATRTGARCAWSDRSRSAPR